MKSIFDEERIEECEQIEEIRDKAIDGQIPMEEYERVCKENELEICWWCQDFFEPSMGKKRKNGFLCSLCHTYLRSRGG